MFFLKKSALFLVFLLILYRLVAKFTKNNAPGQIFLLKSSHFDGVFFN